jgi:GNAT superfamily N-acetyltransferase
MITAVVRRAAPEDAPAVLAVLNEAAGRLAARGIAQWPAGFRPESILPAIGAGELWLAEREGVPVGTVTLQWSDPLWPGDGRAGYVHKLAVRGTAAGLGRELLDWAATATREHGRELLRLDCDAGNGPLRGYYEAAGFHHCHDVELPTEAVPWTSGRVVVSLYERAPAG